MLRVDRDALVCDLAETYGVFDIGSLPVSTVAALAFGLRENSRIKMKMAGAKASTELILLTVAVDCLNFIRWSKTEDAVNNPKKPPRKFLNDLLGIPQAGDASKYVGFKSASDFEKARAKILRRTKDGN